MANFLKSLLSDGAENISSKRVVGFGSFLLFVAFGIVHMVNHTNIQEALIWGTVALISACFALNAAIDIKELSSKSQVASDILKEKSTSKEAGAAKNILNETIKKPSVETEDITIVELADKNTE